MSAHLTSYQSQYIAWLLSRRMNADSADMLASTLVDAQVDLNPHQVDAALFAFQSPLSKGVILAGEVGLGKTIEASERAVPHGLMGVISDTLRRKLAGVSIGLPILHSGHGDFRDAVTEIHLPCPAARNKKEDA